MRSITIDIYPSPVGELILGSYQGCLCLCDWRYRKRREAIDQRIQRGLGAEYVHASDRVLQQGCRQLSEYFLHQRQHFDIPLLMVGTEFQKSVWTALQAIRFGQTLSYQQLAERVERKQAVRAVASANGANALSLFIPCHRVLGQKGDLVGYAGGLLAKQKLLALEQDLFH